jgi:carboxymethylenebutenolidase
MEQMMKANIVLTAGDGHVLPAYRITPDAAPRGQLVVLHEFFGLNDHIRNVADRFAALGYAAIVPGLSDRAEPGAEFGYDPSGIAAGHALRARIPIADSLLDAQAAIDFVKPFGKVGVVGYCWGGSLAFYSAIRLRGLTCAVGYYGSQIVAGAHESPKVPTMLHFGDIDASIPLSDVEKIRQARPDVSIHVYPGRHGFNCDARSNYEPGSAQIALGRTLEFFWKYVG